MIKPFVPLIHDKARETWICGDENGGLLLVTGEMIGIAPSEILKSVSVSEKASSLTIPIRDPNSFFTDVLGYVAPSFGQVVIDLVKREVGNYIVKVGFSKETNTWAYHNWFEHTKDSRSLEDIAEGLFDDS